MPDWHSLAAGQCVLFKLNGSSIAPITSQVEIVACNEYVSTPARRHIDLKRQTQRRAIDSVLQNMPRGRLVFGLAQGQAQGHRGLPRAFAYGCITYYATSAAAVLRLSRLGRAG